jgi:hypothetical protein
MKGDMMIETKEKNEMDKMVQVNEKVGASFYGRAIDYILVCYSAGEEKQQRLRVSIVDQAISLT